MAPFSWHKRNHSFPPAPRYTLNHATALSTPLADIDDEPFLHFLASPDEVDEYADSLHFDAGILSGGEARRQKSQKFKPHGDLSEVRHHHGYFVRRTDHHGWSPASSGRHDSLSPSNNIPIPLSRPSRHSHRTLSGHRHSWREPSPEIFTLDEEVPQIVVSDYDTAQDEDKASSIHDSVLSLGLTSSGSEDLAGIDDGNQSPQLRAASPDIKPDSKLNQMWLVEKARL